MSLSAISVIVAVIVLLLGFTAFFGAPYVPSKRRDIRTAFTQLYPLTDKDMVVDLGSGDGVVLRVAREFGASALGYELHPFLTVLSRALAHGDTRQTVVQASYWRAQFPEQTTVVYAFSDGRDIHKVYALVQAQATRLKRPLALMTYGFDVPGVRADKTHQAYYLYTVPPCSEQTASV